MITPAGKNVIHREVGVTDADIDLALAVMCVIRKPGEAFTYRQIAEATGMSHGGPYAIEQRALKKVRKALTYYSSVAKEVA